MAQRDGYCRFPFGSLGRASGCALARTAGGLHSLKQSRRSTISAPPTLAQREGFEPPEAFTSTVFKTAAFDRSAISAFFAAYCIGLTRLSKANNRYSVACGSLQDRRVRRIACVARPLRHLCSSRQTSLKAVLRKAKRQMCCVAAPLSEKFCDTFRNVKVVRIMQTSLKAVLRKAKRQMCCVAAPLSEKFCDTFRNVKVVRIMQTPLKAVFRKQNANVLRFRSSFSKQNGKCATSKTKLFYQTRGIMSNIYLTQFTGGGKFLKSFGKNFKNT